MRPRPQQEHRAASGCSQGDGMAFPGGLSGLPSKSQKLSFGSKPGLIPCRSSRPSTLGLPLPRKDHFQSGPPLRAASPPHHLLCAVPLPSLSRSSVQNPRPQLWSPKSTGQGRTTSSLLPRLGHRVFWTRSPDVGPVQLLPRVLPAAQPAEVSGHSSIKHLSPQLCLGKHDIWFLPSNW